MPRALCHRFDLPLAGVRPSPSLAEYSYSALALFGAAQEFKKLLQANQVQALRQTLSVSPVQSNNTPGIPWHYPAARIDPVQSESTLDSIPGTSHRPDGVLPHPFLRPGETDPLYL